MTPTVTPILPCRDLDDAERWWARLGFHRPDGQNYPDYRMLFDESGASVHLRAAAAELTHHDNPFGVYLYTPRLFEIARDMAPEIIGADAPEAKPWGMDELALNGPDGLLVHIGWPSHAA